jgi:hypothetical protein
MANRTKRLMGRKMKSNGGKARTKVLRKPKRAAPMKAGKTAKKTAKRAITKARRSKRTPAPQQKQAPELAAAVQTTIVDVIEEPLPGVVTVTEVAAESVALPDSAAYNGEDHVPAASAERSPENHPTAPAA